VSWPRCMRCLRHIPWSLNPRSPRNRRDPRRVDTQSDTANHGGAQAGTIAARRSCDVGVDGHCIRVGRDAEGREGQATAGGGVTARAKSFEQIWRKSPPKSAAQIADEESLAEAPGPPDAAT
jgi:hypothetical protein